MGFSFGIWGDIIFDDMNLRVIYIKIVFKIVGVEIIYKDSIRMKKVGWGLSFRKISELVSE